MSLAISACVLVAFVALLAAGAALVLAISANARSKMTQHNWESSKPAKLAAEVADIAEAVAAHKRSQRSELGRLWARLTPREPAGEFPVAADEPNENQLDLLDSDLAATLALQRAPANSGNGKAR